MKEERKNKKERIRKRKIMKGMEIETKGNSKTGKNGKEWRKKGIKRKK